MINLHVHLLGCPPDGYRKGTRHGDDASIRSTCPPRLLVRVVLRGWYYAAIHEVLDSLGYLVMDIRESGLHRKVDYLDLAYQVSRPYLYHHVMPPALESTTAKDIHHKNDVNFALLFVVGRAVVK